MVRKWLESVPDDQVYCPLSFNRHRRIRPNAVIPNVSATHLHTTGFTAFTDCRQPEEVFSMKRAATTTISFRVNAETRSMIDAARKPFNISPGEYVRGIIIQSLDQRLGQGQIDDAVELRQAVSDLMAENQSLQQSLRRLSFVLLTRLGDMPADAAREAVRHIFSQGDLAERSA